MTRAWTRWQDWVKVGLGAWLFVAAWVLGTAANAASCWNAWLLGNRAHRCDRRRAGTGSGADSPSGNTKPIAVDLCGGATAPSPAAVQRRRTMAVNTILTSVHFSLFYYRHPTSTIS